MVTLLWNTLAVLCFNVLKKRGIFLQECSYLQRAEGNFLPVDTSSQTLRQHRGCETFGPSDGEMSQLHDAKVQKQEAKEKGRRKQCDVRFSFITKNRVFRKRTA